MEGDVLRMLCYLGLGIWALGWLVWLVALAIVKRYAPLLDIHRQMRRR